MEDLSSMFHVVEETVESLKIKLLHAQLKLKSANYLTTQLLNLVHQISEDRDRFKTQLQVLQNQTTTISSSSSLMNYNTESFSFQNNNINNTLSTTTTNLSPFLESATSSSDFSINNIDNLGFFNELPQQQQQQPLPRNYSQQFQQDPSDLVFQNLLRGKVLPEKGKLLESVKKAGPLLHTLLFPGPLPTWRVPPPHQQIQDDDVALPDFSSFGFGAPNSSMVGFGGNQFNYQETNEVTIGLISIMVLLSWSKN